MATPFFDDQVRLAKLSLLRRRIALASDKKHPPIDPLAALFGLLQAEAPELPPQAPPGKAH